MPDDLRRPSELNIPPPGYRVARSRGMDPATRRLALVACVLGALLLAVGGIWAVSGGQGSGTVPVIEAEKGPIKVKPENPGGMQVAGANDSIFSGDSSGGPEALAPPPEAPEPQALRAEQQAEAKPAAAAPSGPAGAPAGAPAGSPAVSGPVASPTAHPAASAAVPPGPAVAPPSTSSSGVSATAARPEARTASLAHAPAPDHAQADARSAASPSGRTEVQLAALDTEAAARTEWERLSKRMPEMLAGRRPDVLRADRDGKVFWRLRTGGFADIAQATAFCERVRAKGAGCAVASF